MIITIPHLLEDAALRPYLKVDPDYDIPVALVGKDFSIRSYDRHFNHNSILEVLFKKERKGVFSLCVETHKIYITKNGTFLVKICDNKEEMIVGEIK